MTDDIEAWEKHFKKIGFVHLPKKKRPDGASQIFLEDPDGHVIELCSKSGEETLRQVFAEADKGRPPVEVNEELIGEINAVIREVRAERRRSKQQTETRVTQKPKTKV